VVALVPVPGQADGDPEGDGLVVAVAQPVQEIRVEANSILSGNGPFFMQARRRYSIQPILRRRE